MNDQTATAPTDHIMSTLCTALVAAQQSAQAVPKDSKNEFHKYKYASTESLIEEARAALSSAGLALITMGWACNPDKTILQVNYKLVHLSGEMLDFQCQTAVVIDKGRPQDKAEATALTYSLGYFLRGLLLLPRVDADHEVDRRNDAPPAPPATKPATAKANPKAPPPAAPAETREVVAMGTTGQTIDVPAEIVAEDTNEIPAALQASEHESILRLLSVAAKENVKPLMEQALGAYRRGAISPDQYKGLKDAGMLRMSILTKGKGAAA